MAPREELRRVFEGPQRIPPVDTINVAVAIRPRAGSELGHIARGVPVFEPRQQADNRGQKTRLCQILTPGVDHQVERMHEVREDKQSKSQYGNRS